MFPLKREHHPEREIPDFLVVAVIHVASLPQGITATGEYRRFYVVNTGADKR
jgi:hypothetical protein